MTEGTRVLLHGKTPATVTSTHAKGKRLGVTTDAGKKTFVSADNAKLA